MGDVNNTNLGVFRFYSDCQLVIGENGSLLLDLTRNKSYELDSDIAKILKWCVGKKYCEIISKHSESFNGVIRTLIEQELCFFTELSKHFESIVWGSKSPGLITSSVIEISDFNNYDVYKVLEDLDELGCKDLLICFDPAIVCNPHEVIRLIECTFDSFFTNLEIIIPVTFEALFTEVFLSRHRRISTVLFLSSAENRILYSHSKANKVYTQDVCISWSEDFDISLFNVNRSTFSEGRTRNLGLNQKVCISRNGDIKNYINHKRSYGAVSTSSLKEIVSSRDFQEKWFVSNDKISKCRRCKFRYICMSNSDIFEEGGEWHKLNYYCSDENSFWEE